MSFLDPKPISATAIAAQVANPASVIGSQLSATYAGRHIHVVPLLGQSEISGRAGEYSLLTDPANPRILQFGCKVRTLRVASEPLDMHDTATGIGPGLQFARRYLATLPADDIVVLVPAAHGGTALSTNATLGWRWGVAGNLSAQFVAQVQEALTAISAAYPGATVTVRAVLFGQGETDSSTTNMIPAATYMADLDALIAGVRSTFANPTLPVILGQMIPESLGTGTRDEINAVHLNTPYRVAHTGIGLTEAGNSNGDLLHSNAKGQRIRGKNMFDEFQRVRVGLAPATPDGDFPPAVLFADDFNRADGVLTGQTTSIGGKVWSATGTGTPRIYSNTAGVDPTGSATRALLTNTVMDGTLKMTLATRSVDASEQIVFRRNDASNELMLSRQNSGSQVWTLFKRVAGTATAVFASAVPITSGDVVEVDMSGTTVTVRVNGSQIYSGTDAQFVLGASNNVGFCGTSNGARFDNLEFWTL